MLERDAPAATAHPGQLMVSADGAFVPLTNGEWREIKSVAMGEFETEWNAKTREERVKTRNIS